MKKIECIIKHERLEELRNQLIQTGVGGMTITEVRGFGKQTTRPESYLVLPKVKIEIYAAEEQVDGLVQTIIRVCRKGEIGDGKIALLPVEELIRIRTGERQTEAVY
jgi:nitrogen regulatory protein P-II 1